MVRLRHASTPVDMLILTSFYLSASFQPRGCSWLDQEPSDWVEDQGARAPVRQRASMAGGGRKRRVDESELSADEERLEAQLEAELAAAEVAADPATPDPSAAAVEPVAELAKPTRHSCRQQAKRSLAAVVELERRNDEEVENEELGGTQGRGAC